MLGEIVRRANCRHKSLTRMGKAFTYYNQARRPSALSLLFCRRQQRAENTSAPVIGMNHPRELYLFSAILIQCQPTNQFPIRIIHKIIGYFALPHAQHPHVQFQMQTIKRVTKF